MVVTSNTELLGLRVVQELYDRTEYGTVSDPDTTSKNLGKSQKKKQRGQRRKPESALENERKDKELDAVSDEFSIAQGQ